MVYCVFKAPRCGRAHAAALERTLTEGGRSCVQDIFLTDGASKGVGFLLSLILRGGGSDGLLVPRYGEMWGDVGRHGTGCWCRSRQPR